MPASRNPEEMFPELSAEEINLLEQRAARYARAPEGQATDMTDAVVFRRGLGKYALPLMALREVRPLRSYCLIPCASPSVPGILHFRGEIISMHDVAAFFDPTEGVGEPSWMIVVEYLGERIALVADEILDVERHSAAKVRPLPITFGDRGIISEGMLPDGTLLLSAARMFHTETFFSAF